VKRTDFTVAGQVICIDAPVKHAFSFTPSISLLAECDSEAEFDMALTTLSTDDSKDPELPLLLCERVSRQQPASHRAGRYRAPYLCQEVFPYLKGLGSVRQRNFNDIPGT
jgi:hypothetical protein